MFFYIVLLFVPVPGQETQKSMLDAWPRSTAAEGKRRGVAIRQEEVITLLPFMAYTFSDRSVYCQESPRGLVKSNTDTTGCPVWKRIGVG